MADIFAPWHIGRLSIPNRLVRSATWDGTAEPDGTPTQEGILLLADLAEGGVGLIITGFMHVSEHGKALAGQTGIHTDAMVGPLTRLTDAVHKAGCLVCAQVVHAGGQTQAETIGRRPLGPSALVNRAFNQEVAELTPAQIEGIVEDFAMAAARARAAGFDAVQLHGAHGYLLSQFLSPHTNRRQDAYGGDLHGRARLLRQVYQAMRDAVGPEFPVLIKLQTTDGLEEGLALEDAVAAARLLDELGMDAIEVSGGVPYAKRKTPAREVKSADGEGYFLENARAVKAAVGCPVFCVGGWRSPERIGRALEELDAVSLARPLVRQPDLARRWRQGSAEPAACISCGGCFVTARQGQLECQQLMEPEG